MVALFPGKTFLIKTVRIQIIFKKIGKKNWDDLDAFICVAEINDAYHN